MIRFGIIGAGNIADKFCRAVKMTQGADVCAVAGKSAQRAELSARRNGIPAWYDSYEAMLEKERPDAVYIATTHNFHRENLLLCISHGIPVLCEKCMVLSAAQAKEVFAAARSKGVFIMEAMWSRFLPGYRRARRWIDAGEIGELRSASYEIGFPAQPGHRVFDPTIGGGALFDIGVYAIEGLTGLITQKLRKTTASLVRSDQGVDLTAHLTMEFESCLASARCSVLTRMPSLAAINGDKGHIVLREANSSAREVWLHHNDGSAECFTCEVENGFQYEIAHFIECLEQGLLESPVIPWADTLQCAEIFDICLTEK